MTHPDPDPDRAASAPDKRHGDPLLNAAQGSGDVSGTRHGLVPDDSGPAEVRETDQRAAQDSSDG